MQACVLQLLQVVQQALSLTLVMMCVKHQLLVLPEIILLLKITCVKRLLLVVQIIQVTIL